MPKTSNLIKKERKEKETNTIDMCPVRMGTFSEKEVQGTNQWLHSLWVKAQL